MCLAVPGRVLSVAAGDDPLLRQARVDFDGVIKEASLACVPEAVPGTWVIVHAGVAIACLDEAEAQETLAALRGLAAAGQGDRV
jgi:hydrogenase expression/formation protein HypC